MVSEAPSERDNSSPVVADLGHRGDSSSGLIRGVDGPNCITYFSRQAPSGRFPFLVRSYAPHNHRKHADLAAAEYANARCHKERRDQRLSPRKRQPFKTRTFCSPCFFAEPFHFTACSFAMRVPAVAWAGGVVAVHLQRGADSFVVSPSAAAAAAAAAVGGGARVVAYPSWSRTPLPFSHSTWRSRNARRARQGSCSLGMKMDVGPGSYVALVTPMTLDGMIDEEALRGLLRWHLDSGTDGIVALGTTGEASVLSTAERELVLDITVEEVGGKVPVVAGTSSVNPVVVIEQSAQAAERGADAVLVVTPAYVKPSQQGLVKFYSMVADQGDLPVVLYNVPGRTAVDMGTAAIAELAKHPKIVGLKDATGDLSRIGELRSACPEEFLFYSGDDATGMEFCLGGGDGLISVTADVAPREMAELVKACRAGGRQAAEAINNKVIKLHSKLFVQGNPVTVKYALARMGLLQDMLRVPLVPMEAEYRDEVDRALESAGLLLPQQSRL